MEKTRTVEVRLYFPNTLRDFHYTYDVANMEDDYVHSAMWQFDSEQADTVFGLYGYAPMDVSVIVNGEEVSTFKLCYQETLWHVFFREHGGPWHGRFQYFLLTLIERRYAEEHKAAKAA